VRIESKDEFVSEGMMVQSKTGVGNDFNMTCIRHEDSKVLTVSYFNLNS
jgi:hypothetical protein